MRVQVRVRPESVTTSAYLPPVLSNQLDSGDRGSGQKRTLLAINLTAPTDCRCIVRRSGRCDRSSLRSGTMWRRSVLPTQVRTSPVGGFGVSDRTVKCFPKSHSGHALLRDFGRSVWRSGTEHPRSFVNLNLTSFRRRSLSAVRALANQMPGAFGRTDATKRHAV